MRDRRLAAGGGIVFVLLGVVAGAILPKPPKSTASAQTIGHYLAHDQHRIEIASAGAAIAALALLLLIVYLHERLAADGFAARLALGGGSALVAVSLLGAVVQGMLAQVGGRIQGDALVLGFAVDEAIFYVAPAFAVIALFAGVAKGAAAAGLPRWLGAAGLVVSAIGLVGGIGQLISTSSAFGAVGFAGFAATVIWVAAASITILRERPGVSAGS